MRVRRAIFPAHTPTALTRGTALALFALLALLAAGSAGAVEASNPRVLLETSKGQIVLELYPDRAPRTVESFLEGVSEGFYDGTLFHRVRRGFMIQAGGYDGDSQLKPTERQLPNEADNGLSNERGTVAMARRGDPHSASVQFFINTVDNAYLDFRSRDARGWGYTVFGRVVEGMDVVTAIEGVPVERSAISEAQPVEPVVIRAASILEPSG